MKKPVVFLFCIATSVSLYAEEWKILGTRPMGMGGAFVAVAKGPVAQYWNPGSLGKTSGKTISTEIPIGVNVEFTGDIMKEASQISDMTDKFNSIKSAQQSGNSLNADQVAAFAKTIALISNMNDPGKGALAAASGGLNFRLKHISFSVNSYASVGASPRIDTVNIGLGKTTGVSGVNMSGMNTSTPADTTTATAVANAISAMGGLSAISNLVCGTTSCITGMNSSITNDAALANALYNQALSSGMSATQITDAANTLTQYAPQVAPIIGNANSANAYTNNASSLNTSGALFTEISAGYGRNVDRLLKGLSVGGNFKLINGQTLTSSFQFLSKSKIEDTFSLKNLKSSWRPALDLGALWDMNQQFPRVPLQPKLGVVVRNLNRPSFDTDAGFYDLDPQVRMGFAINPKKFWTVALDLDLTNNSTPVQGFHSRELSVGTEINVFDGKFITLPIRAGLIKNVADSSSKIGYTFGTGLDARHFRFDLSGVISSELTEIKGNSIPTKVGVVAGLGFMF
jgi:hypothetical protein